MLSTSQCLYNIYIAGRRVCYTVLGFTSLRHENNVKTRTTRDILKAAIAS